MIDDSLFVTGMQRSGTTLLEKLLASQSGVSMLSQPFPLLFVEIGRAFLGDDYPLGRLTDSAALDEFMRQWRPSRAHLTTLFAQMAGYSGQYTRFTPGQVDAALAKIEAEDDFAEVVRKLDRFLSPKTDARWFGSKESFCDDFVPPLHARGFRCAIVVRDPRDVVASLNHGRGRDFGGEIKPTLFNVRNWRRSVAVARSMQGRPRFHCCRYEDVVRDPSRSLSALGRALEIDVDPERLDLRGWRGNSSFSDHDGVSAASVGVHRSVLPDSVIRFIEATCLPELRLLGYETTMTPAEAIEVIGSFREPYTTRGGMESDAVSPQNAAIEAARLR